MAIDAETVRLAVAKQPTVSQSVALLVHAFAATAQEAISKPDPEHLAAFANALDSNPKAWVDAVFANTPMADQTVSIEPVSLPSEVRDAFAKAAKPDPHKR